MFLVAKIRIEFKWSLDFFSPFDDWTLLIWSATVTALINKHTVSFWNYFAKLILNVLWNLLIYRLYILSYSFSILSKTLTQVKFKPTTLCLLCKRSNHWTIWPKIEISLIVYSRHMFRLMYSLRMCYIFRPSFNQLIQKTREREKKKAWKRICRLFI